MARQRYRNFKSAGWRGIVIGISGNLQINSGGFSFCSRKNNRIPSLIHCKNGIFGGSSLKEYIEERVLSIADYIIENETTVRQTAKKFGVSKSTVHKDVTERLAEFNPAMASKVRAILDVNKQERHIRGGMATREKYLHMR